MTINDRIKIVRGNLSQREFGERIGATRNQVAFAEGKDNTVTGLFLASVCGNFGINSDWLINGEGEMFANQAKKLESSDQEREAAEKYLLEKIQRLPEDCKKDVLKFCLRLLKAESKNF